MKRLIFYELKKIFHRKYVLAAILLTLLVNVGSFTSMGLADIRYEQSIASKYEGPLDDDKVQRMLEDFMPSSESLQKWQGLGVFHISLNSMQSAVHTYFANEDGTWNGKTVSDVFGGEIIQAGYHFGWFELSQTIIRVMLAVSVLCILIAAPVFSSEYGGADRILLAARYGRTKCALAKAAAAFLASLSLCLVFLMGNLLAGVAFNGTTGLDTSVLFCGFSYQNYIPFNISCGEMLLYQACLAVSATAMLTGVTLLLSAACRTQTAALAASSLAFFSPMLLSVLEKNPLFRILGLLPVYQLQFSQLMSVGQLDGGLPYAVWAIPAAALTAGLGVFLSYRLFTRHSV